MAFSWYFCPGVLQYGYLWFFPLGLWLLSLACRVGSYLEDLDGLLWCIMMWCVDLAKREFYGRMFVTSGIYFKKHVTKPSLVMRVFYHGYLFHRSRMPYELLPHFLLLVLPVVYHLLLVFTCVCHLLLPKLILLPPTLHFRHLFIVFLMLPSLRYWCWRNGPALEDQRYQSWYIYFYSSTFWKS